MSQERVETARRVDLLAIAKSETTLKKSGQKEWSGSCPSCGGDDRFSIRDMGDQYLWVCRGCSDGRYHDAIDYWRHFHGATFTEALDYLAGDDDRPSPVTIRDLPETPPEPQKRPDWYGRSHDWYNARYRSNTAVSDAMWQAYRPLSDKVIHDYRLGFGALPSSKCKHDRLVLPVFENGKLVNLRGRSLGCGCDGKWLASGGWQLDGLPLYNGDQVSAGALVVVVESPVDAIQIQDRQDETFKLVANHVPHAAMESILALAESGATAVAGVATYSTAYWRPEWQELVAKASAIVVAFDNDLAGNGGGKHHQQLAKARADQGLPPVKSRGIWLVNHLLEDGLPAILLSWDAPVKMDVGQYLEERNARTRRVA